MKAYTVGLLVYEKLFRRGRGLRVTEELDAVRMSTRGHLKGVTSAQRANGANGK